MKRFIIITLLLSIVLTGCSNKSSETKTTESTSDITSTEVIETQRLMPDIPDSDFGGYTFRILARGENAGDWVNYDIESEGLNGDVVNDNVYNRNLKVGEKLNIKIKHERVNGV